MQSKNRSAMRRSNPHASEIKFALLCDNRGAKGSVNVINGNLTKPSGGSFSIRPFERIELLVKSAKIGPGSSPAIAQVKAGERSFAFFLRDVKAGSPIFLPSLGFIVTSASDRRGYAEIVEDIRCKGLQSGLTAMESAPEETYEDACVGNRSLICPTWLGLSRDMRFFEVCYQKEMGFWGYIHPRYHSVNPTAPELKGTGYTIGFILGPGASCRSKITRRLEEGYLPILKSQQIEDDIIYDVTAFATLETKPVTIKNLRGSEWQACYPNCGGFMLNDAEKESIKPLVEKEMRGREEETVCCIRAEATNKGTVPRYAWFKGAHMMGWAMKPLAFDRAFGSSSFDTITGRVVAVQRLNGAPAPDPEMAILLQPGECAVYEILVPHQPLPKERGVKLAKLDFDKHLEACRTFWKAKLAAGTNISVPEAAIDERIKAGLLHCDIVALGREPNGPVLATIGWYAPIGSESAPIIQFFDSMGWHKLAERSLQFFLERQRADGFIQNFGGYQLETGPALWTMGEHFRYTGDKAWVRRIKPNLLKACEYLLAWRERNKRKDLVGKGYGMLDGKVGDPEDFYHSFMLNGLSYIGIKRTAEMLADVAPAEAKRLGKEAAAFLKDIRKAYFEAIARAPVIPLGDGTWAMTSPPWAEHTGPVSLYAEGGEWFTHGTFSARDSLAGAHYLVLSEVLGAREPQADMFLNSHQQLYTVRNGGISQPYYCRHDYMHLLRDEVKPFLMTYYNQFSALQDRETYTFWEHYFYASQHKTHEEGWFLMQTRWMLWMEEGSVLRLMRAIPRKWMENGKRVQLRNAASYFGPISLNAESHLSNGIIQAEVECRSGRKPKEVVIRLPHPDSRLPIKVEGGTYIPELESVRIRNFSGRAIVRLHF